MKANAKPSKRLAIVENSKDDQRQRPPRTFREASVGSLVDEEMHGQRGFLSDLNLLITKTCTAACAHCSVESSPTNRQKMSEDTFANVLKLIEVFAKLPESRRIVVTGGEPYLERERLKQIVALAHHEGLRMGVETNGYWARNYDQGVRLIEQIPMDDYLLSTSTFHVEYVPMKAVENVWRAATDAGRRVMIRITQSVPPSEHDLKLLEEVRAVIPDKYIKIEQAAAAGRAVETGVAPALQQFDATDDRCPADGPLVDDRGLVHPCCNALSIVEDHALEMGRMGQDSPDVILERLATDALFTSLREEGIAKVAARATGPDNPTPRLRGDACNRCYNLFADLNLRAGLKTLR